MNRTICNSFNKLIVSRSYLTPCLICTTCLLLKFKTSTFSFPFMRRTVNNENSISFFYSKLNEFYIFLWIMRSVNINNVIIKLISVVISTLCLCVAKQDLRSITCLLLNLIAMPVASFNAEYVLPPPLGLINATFT